MQRRARVERALIPLIKGEVASRIYLRASEAITRRREKQRPRRSLRPARLWQSDDGGATSARRRRFSYQSAGPPVPMTEIDDGRRVPSSFLPSLSRGRMPLQRRRCSAYTIRVRMNFQTGPTPPSRFPERASERATFLRGFSRMTLEMNFSSRLIFNDLPVTRRHFSPPCSTLVHAYCQHTHTHTHGVRSRSVLRKFRLYTRL